MRSKGQLGMDLLIPAELETEAFREAWAGWLADRAERRLPKYTARALTLQLRRLAEMGPERAVRAIEWSIAQGYKGIWEEKGESREQGAGSRERGAKSEGGTWGVAKRLEVCEGRLKELRSRSPGEHCLLADFLSKAELAEYGRLWELRRELRGRLLEG
jgi:hypothetical protein